MVAPVIMAFGTPDQQARFLPGIASGEVWWGQGYSEPGSGSDLASLKTKAERQGTKYIVNGQKTWTTSGQYGEWIFCLVRTSNEGKPQTGISFLLINMQSPGVTVRSIVLLEGSVEVNEVFFDNVEVPAENLIGEENKGWPYAKYLLSHERTNIADVNRTKRELERLKKIAKAENVCDDHRFRDQIAKLEVDVVTLEMLVLRVLAAEKSGKQSLDIAGLLKIRGSEIQQRYSELMMLADGPYALPLIREAMEAGWQGNAIGAPHCAALAPTYLNMRKTTVYGGSNQVQRNIVAQVVLGRPGDQRHPVAQARRGAPAIPTTTRQVQDMDFDFSDEQLQLRDAVRKWVAKEYSFERRRMIIKTGGYSRDVYRELATLGLCGLYVAESDGGLGMGPVEAMVVLEEFGRGIVLEPITQALIAGAVLSVYAPRGLATAHLAGIANGDSLVVLAHQERDARYRLGLCSVTASASGDGWTLSGIKSLVSVGDLADTFIVPATIDGVMALFLVQRRTDGVHTRGYGTLDGGRAAEVEFKDASAELITTDGLRALEYAAEMGIAATCAEAIGVLDQTMSITTEYMNTRKQFGMAISSFQALRHRAADMKMQLKLARSMSCYASLKLNAPRPERRAALARAKYQLGVSMRFIGQQAIQLHGGIGVADDCVVSHYFKRLTQMEMTFGDTLHNRGEVAQRMQDSAGVFA